MRLRRFICLYFAIATLLLASPRLLAHCESETICTCPNSPRVERSYNHGRWFVIETDNFQICSDGSESCARHLARHAEALRTELTLKWFGKASPEALAPKCQIVLHSSRASYTGAVGRGSTRTVGSSLVDIKPGRIRSRRIDLLGGQTEFLTAALPHELTHVVLKERFPATQLPRWADEGMAMLADTEAKQNRHRNDLRNALKHRTIFNLAALVTMEEYPRSDRWGTFYGQSVSLTKFLVMQRTPEQFVRFIVRSTAKGYDAALQECYGIAGVGELDRKWRLHLNSIELASSQGG